MHRGTEAHIDRRRLLVSLAATSALRSGLFVSFDEIDGGRGVFRLASPGNSLIVTSAELIATDSGSCPHAATKTHIEELAQRLGHALEMPKVQKQMASAKSRLFALGGITVNHRSDSLIFDFQTLLDRQVNVLSASLGQFAADDLPAYIATSMHDGPDLYTNVLDTLAYITVKSGFCQNAKMIRAADIFSVARPPLNHEVRCPDTFDLIALWPLKDV